MLEQGNPKVCNKEVQRKIRAKFKGIGLSEAYPREKNAVLFLYAFLLLNTNLCHGDMLSSLNVMLVH